jgi:spermidine/putrescine transport system permease protein
LKHKSIGLFGKTSIGLFATWLGLFALIPFALVFCASFLTKGEESFLVWEFSWQSYLKIIDPLYGSIFVSSLKLSLLTSLLTLIFALPFAYFLSTLKGSLKSLGLLLMIIPFWTSSLVRTYALIAILKTEGILNSALLFLGLVNEPLHILYTQHAVMIGMVYTLLPFMILPIYASFEKLDHRYIEAARDLGANSFWLSIKIVLPLISPGIVAGVILVFLPSMGMFFIPDLLGGAKDLIVGNFIRNQFLTFRDWPFGSVASVVLTLIMLGMIYLYTKVGRFGSKKDDDALF